MELKVICQCGQKYKFDVEPVNGTMPFTVNCPVCTVDGTARANELLAHRLATPPLRPEGAASVTPPPPPPRVAAFSAPASSAPPPPVFAPAQAAPAPPPIAPMAGGLKINREAHPEPAATPPAIAPADNNPRPPAGGSMRPFAVAAAANPPKKTSFGMGLLGGFIGALVGVIIYFLVFKYTGLRFKLLAIGVGALAGWLADFLGKGEGSKELGGITAVLVLAGVVGAQYFVALGWWHEGTDRDLKYAQSAYANAVIEAKEVVKVVPTGSDAEIRSYMVKEAKEDGDKVEPAGITDDDVKTFRDNDLQGYQKLANGQVTKEQYEQEHHVRASDIKAEADSEEGTFKAIFLLLLISKSNLFSLAAAAALAFKLSTNA